MEFEMPSRGPSTLALPPFRGAVRQIVLANVLLFFLLALLSFASPAMGDSFKSLLPLFPYSVVKHGFLWQLITYAFFNTGILGTAFSLLTLWFTGSMLEDTRGPRWFVELFYTSAFGGAVIATLLAALPLLTHGRVSFLGMQPLVAGAGVSAPLFGVLVAFAVLFGDVEFLLFFLLRIKAKYIVVLGVLIDLATLVRERDSFSALLSLCCGLCGYLFVRFAARRGLSFALNERYFGMRNDYLRWKRRRAARKFEVYMRKQNRTVRFDNEGRYIEPEDEVGSGSGKRGNGKGNDRWTN
jgi:membrane associated rhomboid family serine protease